MLVIAQNSQQDGSAALLFLPLLVVMALALIPANIAKKKGYSFALFYVLGIFFFLIMLIVSIAITDKRKLATTPAASAPITWTQSGQRYLFGHTDQDPYYGIWDRQTPGPPIAKYPYTEHGKAEALARFADLEPSAQPVTQSLPPSPPMPPLPPTP